MILFGKTFNTSPGMGSYQLHIQPVESPKLIWYRAIYLLGAADGQQVWLENLPQIGNTLLLLTGNNWPPHLAHTSVEQASQDLPAPPLIHCIPE